MALYKLNHDAKELRAGTYLKISDVSKDQTVWWLEVVHHDTLPYTLRAKRAFQRAELPNLLTLSISDQYDVPEDKLLIQILNPSDINEEILHDLDPVDVSAMEEEIPSTSGRMVGMMATDTEKLEVEDFITKVLIFKTGVDTLTPPEGTDLESFREKVTYYTALQDEILGILNSSSKIRAAADRIGPPREDDQDPPLGVYGLIYDYDPLLLEASYVLRAAKSWLEKEKEFEFPVPQETLQSCPQKARAGEVIVRAAKKYLSYQAIWKGKKWTSAKLDEKLCVEGSKKKKAEARRHLNPIAQLSKQNLERLKQNLLENAKDAFDFDPRAQIVKLADVIADRRMNVEEIHVRAVKELEALLANLQTTTAAGLKQATTNVTQSRAMLLKTERQLLHLADLYESPAVRAMGLMPEEIALFGAIVALPFTIKHATPNWYCVRNDGSLDSLREFQKKNPRWTSEFSTPGNVSKLGNHGFVFFRVDVGRDPVVTRYGDTQIVEDLSVIETDGWISLFDQLKPLSSTTMVRYYDHKGALIRHASVEGTNDFQQVYEYGYLPPKPPDNPTKQAPSFSKTHVKAFKGEHWAEMRREEPFSNFVFWGRHIRSGIALSLIWELRLLDRSGYREHVLETFAQTAGEARTRFLGRLIGQTFRPEGKYPAALRFTKTRLEQTTVHKPEGDKRWNLDATANDEIMNIVKLIQRRKYLSDAVPQARKTHGAHQKHYQNAAAKLQFAEMGEISKLQQKRDQQKEKMEKRKKEWDELAVQQNEVEKAYAEAKANHPELFPNEDADEGAVFRRGV